jgi:hypothetical protein
MTYSYVPHIRRVAARQFAEACLVDRDPSTNAIGLLSHSQLAVMAQGFHWLAILARQIEIDGGFAGHAEPIGAGAAVFDDPALVEGIGDAARRHELEHVLA